MRTSIQFLDRDIEAESGPNGEGYRVQFWKVTWVLQANDSIDDLMDLAEHIRSKTEWELGSEDHFSLVIQNWGMFEGMDYAGDHGGLWVTVKLTSKTPIRY